MGILIENLLQLGHRGATVGLPFCAYFPPRLRHKRLSREMNDAPWGVLAWMRYAQATGQGSASAAHPNKHAHQVSPKSSLQATLSTTLPIRISINPIAARATGSPTLILALGDPRRRPAAGPTDSSPSKQQRKDKNSVQPRTRAPWSAHPSDERSSHRARAASYGLGTCPGTPPVPQFPALISPPVSVSLRTTRFRSWNFVCIFKWLLLVHLPVLSSPFSPQPSLRSATAS